MLPGSDAAAVRILNRFSIPDLQPKTCDSVLSPVSRFPRRNSQSPVVQLPTPIAKQLSPALPFHFLNPLLPVLFAHPFNERLPEHSNPVFQSALSLFQHRRPLEQRCFTHFQSMPL